MKRVSDIVGEIAAASQEQTTGIEQVNSAMMQMDQVTQANSAQTEELSSTAQSVSGQAMQLQSLVSRFTVDVRRTGKRNVDGDARVAAVSGASARASHPKPRTHVMTARTGRSTGHGPSPSATNDQVTSSLANLSSKVNAAKVDDKSLAGSFEEF